MDITELQINPTENDKKVAFCTATFNNVLVVKNIWIYNNKKDCLMVRFPNSLSFKTPEAKKEATNRILATYVINHCVDDYKV